MSNTWKIKDEKQKLHEKIIQLSNEIATMKQIISPLPSTYSFEATQLTSMQNYYIQLCCDLSDATYKYNNFRNY